MYEPLTGARARCAYNILRVAPWPADITFQDFYLWIWTFSAFSAHFLLWLRFMNLSKKSLKLVSGKSDRFEILSENNLFYTLSIRNIIWPSIRKNLITLQCHVSLLALARHKLCGSGNAVHCCCALVPLATLRKELWQPPTQLCYSSLYIDVTATRSQLLRRCVL